MRCFLAVELDASLTEKIASLQKTLAGPGIKPVNKENFHFTIKFLGEIDDRMVESIRPILSDVAERTKAFEINLQRVGSFPNEKSPRVVWVGTRSHEFTDLHNLVDEKLGKYFTREKPVPHLTLARITENSPVVHRFLAENKNMELGTMKVSRIKLKKSMLTGRGPIYEDLEEFRLGI